jgi:hypothetical protein
VGGNKIARQCRKGLFNLIRAAGLGQAMVDLNLGASQLEAVGAEEHA